MMPISISMASRSAVCKIVKSNTVACGWDFGSLDEAEIGIHNSGGRVSLRRINASGAPSNNILLPAVPAPGPISIAQSA